MIFAFPDAATGGDKKPIPYNKDQPFKNLGIREISQGNAATPLVITDVKLTMREFAGVNGIQQILKKVDV